MSLAVIDLITEFFYSIFGNGIIMATIIIFTIVMVLMAMRVNLAVIMAIVIPLIIGFVLNTAFSNFIEIAPWLVPISFIIAGFLFWLLFGFFLR